MINKLKQYYHNPDAKKLVGNVVWLSLLQLAGYVFSLLTIPYLAHVLGVKLYGAIAFAMAIMVYFQTLVDYGFIFSAVRDIARVREDKESVSEIYSNVMWTRWLIVAGSFVLLLLLIFIVPKFYEMKWLLIASFLIVIGQAMFPEWLFQGMEKMKFITIFNIAIKLVFTIAVFVFIRSSQDYILQPVLMGMGYIVSGAIAMWLIKRWGIRMRRPQFVKMIKSLKSNFDLFLNQIIPNLYNSASVLMLGFFHGNAANGIFDAANRFTSAGIQLFSAVSRTFFPFLSRRMDKHSFYRNLNLIFSSCVAVVLFLGAPFIIHLFFSSDFDGAIVTLQILSVSMIFLALNNIYGTNYLILKGYERELRRIILYSSVLGLVIGIPLMYYFSYIGVALTILFSRGLMGVWSWLKARSIEAAKCSK